MILAEGTPAETYIDYAGRQGFDNYADYIALYGEGRMIPEHPAPRITGARQLPPALRARLGIVGAALSGKRAARNVRSPSAARET